VTDVVVVSLEPWDGVWRRNQHLVSELLLADPFCRVLFAEPATDPIHAALAGRTPRRGRGLRRGPSLEGVSDEQLWLYEPTKWLPRRLDHRVDARLARSIANAATRARFDSPVLWINDPAGASLLEATGLPALYDITDDWLAADRPSAAHGRLVRNERLLLQGCAEVVVCSPHLRTTKGATRAVTMIPNAVDVDAYAVEHPRPHDLPSGRVAVYVGTVHTDRMDVDLCVDAARAIDGVGHLVLVGPALLARSDLQRLRDAHVTLTGAKNFADVPAYLRHADVLVVPHLVNAFTDSLDPIKVYEYRAARRPVVSTPVAGFRDGRSPAITLAVGGAFTEAVHRALATPPAPDVVPAELPTWTDRATQMRTVLARTAQATN
jgi:teichuronic acid biosynthesis glycosyltransferase TuaH